MQLFVLIMMIALNAQSIGGIGPHDARYPELQVWEMLLAVLGPMAVLAFAHAVWCTITRASLAHPGVNAARRLRRLDQIASASRWLTMGLFLWALFGLGWFTWLRVNVSDWVLIPELLAIAPVLGVLIVGWWAHYPIDRRLREASLMRQLDQGESIAPIWSRGQYVWGQVRHQLLLLMLPLLAFMAWADVVEMMPAWWMSDGWARVVFFTGGAAIFLFTPLVIRHVWDTVMLPAGPLRERLVDMCRRYGVRVREMLLWRTHSGVTNAAVLGILPRMRYILLTDGLIEQLPSKQVEAVMAHEVAHVRRHHMPWLIICGLAPLGVCMLMIESVVWSADRLFEPTDRWIELMEYGGIIASLVLWALVFGYVSRRFERQADTFAVQHLSTSYADADARPNTIHRGAVDAMAGALQQVARLNHMPTTRPSWRHGSIQWRVNYLKTLVGHSITPMRIDREVRRLCAAGVFVMGVLIAAAILLDIF